MSLMMGGQAVHVPTVSFDEMAGRVMEDLQVAVREVISSLPQAVRRAVDLERALELERKLAWQVFRLSRATGLSEVTNVPSLGSGLRVAAAARARGVPDPVLERFRQSFERFESF